MADETAELDRIEAARDAIVGTVFDLGDSALRRPTPDAWSPAEIVEHLVRAEDFGILGLWRAIEALDDDEATHGPSPTAELAGRTIDEIFSNLPSRVDAPEAVVPIREGRPAAYWIGRLRAHQASIVELASAMEAVGPGRIELPHFVAGPLDGRQRLQFFRWHLERHLGQLRRTVATLDSSAA